MIQPLKVTVLSLLALLTVGVFPLHSQRGEPQVKAYDRWLEQEAIPVVRGYYIEDLRAVKVEPWQRLGGLGAYIELEGMSGLTNSYVLEIPAGQVLRPERHNFDEIIYVLSGQGSTTVWYEGMPKQTVHWKAGALFSPPLNAWHQHVSSGGQAARFVAVTHAPLAIDLYRNFDFIFNNDFIFRDRYDGREDYFGSKGKPFLTAAGEAGLEINFLPDVRTSDQLRTFEARGPQAKYVQLQLSGSTLGAHLSEWPVGTYQKAHWHGPSASVILVTGTGYSLMWHKSLGTKPFSEGKGDEVIRVDWKDGTMVTPLTNWFHQHFNTGSTPARYVAIRGDSARYQIRVRAEMGSQLVNMAKSIEEGGNQIEYKNEDPEIRRMFERELEKSGLKSLMPPVGVNR